MANYCYNEVSFSGDAPALAEVNALFTALNGQEVFMPDFMNAQKGHYLEAEISASGILSYRTRWDPNIGVMAEVSQHFGVDHRHFYYEPLMGIIGEAILKGQQLSNTRLVMSDLYAVGYDAATDQWSFGEETRDSEYDIHRYMIDEKRRLAESEPAARRLAGVLPHIDLAGRDFIFDCRLRELRETDAPWNRISFDQFMPNEKDDGYLFFYDRRSHQAGYIGTPEDMPAEVCLLEIPQEVSIDPVAVARENKLSDTDLLLAYPYRENHHAEVIEVSQFINREATRHRGR